MKAELKLTGNWQKMSAAVDPKKFKGNLDTNIGKATRFNGLMLVAEIRRRIKARRYAANSPFTILVKKSSLPLVDDGDLFGAITSKVLDEFRVFVGVLRNAHGTDSMSLINLAELLHHGATINVTEHMRNMFILLSEVGQGKRDISTLEGRAAELAKALGSRIKLVKPLKPGTKVIRIPARPYMKDVLEDKAILAKVKKNWERAIDAAMKAQAQ